MVRICVVTSDGRAYYALVSRLRKAGFPFFSMLPDDNSDECELVLTTSKEAHLFRRRDVMIGEELDSDPDVTRGQILSRLTGGGGTLLIGIDPGLRMGMAAFYGETKVASHTFNSMDRLCAAVLKLVGSVRAVRSTIRIGNGNPSIADTLASTLMAHLPDTTVEIVDESGTSLRHKRAKGMQTDQSAAARIAFRKGMGTRVYGQFLGQKKS